MSVFKAFFGLGKIPQVVKFFEFQSFDDVNKMGGAIRALKEQSRMSGTQLTKAQERYLDDQMKQVEMVFEQMQQPSTQSGIRSTKSAKIFDLQGNKIDPNKPIMGGTQEREAEILERMNKSNKKNVGIIKKRKMREEISKVNDQIEEMIESGVDEMNPKLGKLYDKQNDLELRLDLEDMMNPDPEDFATGGRAGFKAGLGKRFLELLKGKPKPKFDVERFREGPIDLKFLENVDKKDLAPFIRSRDTMGPGGYGMYDDFADMPAGLQAAELIKTIKTKDGGINYSMAEMFIGKKLKGNESVDELIQMVTRKEMRAEGGRIGYAGGTPNKKITIDAAGSKSGKQQIMGAPEGITMDNESINAIIKADIPISQKIDLLAKYQYGKGRTRIERDDQEIVLDEGGFKSRDIGLGFNKDGEGIGGTLMYNLETGEPQFNIGFKKRFANGGRIGLKAGMTKRAFLKLMGGVGAGIAGLKSGLLGIGKGVGKEAAKEIITTPAAAGKPAWFDALVTRVINEGEDVTKKFATKDREIVHATKIDDDAMVTVYRDLDDGTVRVDIDDATTNVMGEQGDSVVSMEVKGGQLEEGVKGKTPVEFEAREADYRNYMDGPDDYTTETIDNVVGDTKDLTADLTKVKMYAKGQKKPTIKEMMIQRDRAIRLKQAEENPAEYAADRGPDIDTKDYDYAAGGIARMLGE